MDVKVLAVDLGETSVSAVLVVTARGERRIAGCCRVALSDEDVWQKVGQAVETIGKQNDLSGAACIVSIPDDAIFYRNIRLPFSDRKKIEKVLSFELAPLLPVKLDDLIIDFYAGAPVSAEDTEASVFIAAVLKSQVEEYVSQLAALGLSPEMIVPRGVTAAAAVPENKGQQAVLVKDGNKVVFSCIANDCVQFIRVFRLEGKREKQAAGLGAALWHTLLAYEEISRADFAPEIVYLYDGGFQGEADGLAQTVQKHLAAAVKPLDTENRADFRVDPASGYRDYAGGLDMALNLALLPQSRRPYFNFRKNEFAVSGKWRQYARSIARTGLLALLVLLVWLAGFYYEIHHSQAQIAALERKIRNVFKECCPEVSRIVDPPAQLQARLKQLKKESGMPVEMDRKADTIDILNDVSRLIPPQTDVVVTRLVTGPEELTITGNINSFNAVDTIKNRLGKSKYFAEIEITSAKMDKIDQRVHFKLRVALL